MKKIQTLCTLACLLLVTSAAIARDLQEGMKGEDVKRWQLFLIRQGYMKPPALGTFSKRTRQATVAFQQANGLQGLGMVGPKTVAVARTRGYGSTSGGTVSSKPRSNGGRGGASLLRGPASPEVQKIIMHKVAAYLSENVPNPRSMKFSKVGGAQRVASSEFPYLMAVAYSFVNDDGDRVKKTKVFLCNAAGDIVAVRNAEDFGYRGN